MKIAFINICDNGSTGKIMTDICEQLPENVEKVCYVGHKYTDKSYVKPIHGKFGYRVHKFLSQYLGLDELGSYFATLKMISELKKFRPDILHLHNIHSFSINYVLLFKYIKNADIKIIWTLHDCWAFTGGCFYFDYSECTKWKKICTKCNNRHQRAMAINWDNAKKMFNIKKKAFSDVKNLHLVVPSNWLKALVENSFLALYRTTVINNGIDCFYFNEKMDNKFEINIDKKILLAVASPFNKRKGFEDYLSLSKILSKDYVMVMIGLNQSQIDILPNNIVGIKRTESRQELAAYYRKATALLNFTYEDNFPTVNLEAICCGTPIICYNTGGATEMINEKNGIIIDKGDYKKVPELLSKICYLKENSSSFSKEAQKKYSKDNMLQEYMKLYKED